MKNTMTPEEMNSLEMIAAYLSEHGYDGLYYEGECACKKDDLAPCGESANECEAGYLMPGDDEVDWRIGPKPDKSE